MKWCVEIWWYNNSGKQIPFRSKKKAMEFALSKYEAAFDSLEKDGAYEIKSIKVLPYPA